MPAVNIAGYQGFGGNVGLYPEVLNIQGQVNVTHVKGSHTLRVGSDNRRHGRKISNLGNTSGVVNYTNLYTRAADDTTVFPAGDLGLSLGRVHARHAAVVFDRRFRRAATPLVVLLGLRSGHVAGLAGT